MPLGKIEGADGSLMDSHSSIFIIVICLLVIFSALFSATEAAFASLSKLRLRDTAEGKSQKSERAKRTLKLCESENIGNLFSAALIWKTILNVVAVTMAASLFMRIFENVGILLAAVIMALIILAFGEIVPKSLARQAPERFAMFISPFARFFMIVFKPVIFVYRKLSDALGKLVKTDGKQALTGSELLNIVRYAEDDGNLDVEESELITNVIEFNDIAAIDIMTPRVDVIAVEKSSENRAVADLFSSSGYSRLPVYDESIDSVLGLVNQKNFFSEVWGTKRTVMDVLRPVEYIPPSMKISVLLKLLQKNKVHLAVVVDEFGGTEGIVTLEDVLEELVGEIWDEHDEIERESFKRTGMNTYCVYSSADLDDFFEFFNIKTETDSSTINGWVSEMLDKIPQVGDNFTFLDMLNIRVISVEGNHIDELQITGEPIPESAYEEDSKNDKNDKEE